MAGCSPCSAEAVHDEDARRDRRLRLVRGHQGERGHLRHRAARRRPRSCRRSSPTSCQLPVTAAPTRTSQEHARVTDHRSPPPRPFSSTSRWRRSGPTRSRRSSSRRRSSSSSTTTDGLIGRGYSYTIGTGGTAVLAMLRDHLLPRLIGQDARNVEGIWYDLFASTRATTRRGDHLARAGLGRHRAVGSALPARRRTAVAAGRWVPPGRAAVRHRGRLVAPADDELVAGALASQKAGWPGVKIKVGKPRVHEDVERLTRRTGCGRSRARHHGRREPVDDGAEAMRRAAAFEPLDLGWFEEPLPADDLTGHVRLAESTSIPIAVGESMYSVVAVPRVPRAGCRRRSSRSTWPGSAASPRG